MNLGSTILRFGQESSRKLRLSAFHEKAGPCQEFFALSMSLLSFPVQPSRLCRHPSIRTLM
jgi:hypothetical protein